MVSLILLCFVPAAASAEGPADPDAASTLRNAGLHTQRLEDAIVLQRGPTCLEEARLERRVARWLERDRVRTGLRIQVYGGPSPERVRFTLSWANGRPAERDLGEVPGDCGDRHAAVALAIAVAIDASPLSGLSEDESQALAVDDGRESLWEPGLAVSAGGGVGIGFLAAPAPAGYVAMHVGLMRHLELRLSGSWIGLHAQRWAEVDAHYDAELLAGGIGLGPKISGHAFEAGGTVELLAGRFRTEATGLLEAEPVAKPYWAIGLGLDARIRLAGPLSVRVSVELVVPLASRAFVVTDAEGNRAHALQVAPIAVFAGIGPALRFF